jgi:hypothetical protein
MIETRINQLDRDDQSAKHFRDRAMGVYIRSKFVTAEKNVTTEERVTFAFEIKFRRKPMDLVAMRLHPLRKKGRFTGAFFMAKIARDETQADGQASMGSMVRGCAHR